VRNEHNWFDIFILLLVVINICHAYSHTLYLLKVGDEEVAWVLTTIWGVSLCFNLQGTCFHCSLYCVTNCG